MFEEKSDVEFMVQGSAADPYRVRFIKSGDNLSAYCTCPAGKSGMYCKHRFGILEGNTAGIVSVNVDQVGLVSSWLPGSDVEAAIQQVKRVEDQLATAKKNLKSAKKSLAAAMMD